MWALRRGRVVSTPPPGSNLGPEAGYPDWGFSWFSLVLPGKFWGNSLKLGHDRFLQNPFQFIIHYQLIIRRYIVRVTEKAS
jgi:hypothetical protein